MKTLLAHILVAMITAACTVAAAPAAGPAKPQAATFHVTGLFERDREVALREAVAQIPSARLVSLDFDFAEATFDFDAAQAFPGMKPEKFAERFDQLVKTASDHTLGIQPRSATPRDKLARIEFFIEPLDCKACAFGVYGMISKVPGVEQTTVDMKEGRITCRIDAEKTNVDELKATLKKREVKVKE